MALITWNESLSVKIDSIDKEHKQLVAMLNEFYDNIILKPNKENVAKLLAQMKDYSIFHFGHEEELMKKYGYPGFRAHKSEHEEFIAKVKDMEERFSSGKLILSLEVTTFLKDWLQNHIMVTDKRYSDFFVDRGVK